MLFPFLILLSSSGSIHYFTIKGCKRCKNDATFRASKKLPFTEGRQQVLAFSIGKPAFLPMKNSGAPTGGQ
jgi:hypothetical protein